MPDTFHDQPPPGPESPGQEANASDKIDQHLGEARTLVPLPDSSAKTTTGTLPLVPGYEILGKLGEGGMGVVYKARQIKLNRIVALKMILSGGHAREGDRARFRTEGEAIARLQHPNIVQVYEVGEHDGTPFFSLEFCSGGSLEIRLKGIPLPPREAARLVQTLALAMHAAHERNVIHRDLKPANVLLTRDGTPKITDFGLAKKMDDKGQTASGSIMGTPSYMAPEQAEARKTVGPPADIYALGAILYEMLTGRPPFRAETPLDTLMQVLEREPAPPRLLNPSVDRDLETICLKCLEKGPQQRYLSAEALARDLERYLAGDSISARGFNVLDRLAHTLGRSQSIAEFHSWSRMLLLFGLIIFLGHLTTFVLLKNPLTHSYSWLPRVGQFVLMSVVFWCYRPSALLPTSAAERQLWSIWLGYLLAYGVSILVTRVMIFEKLIDLPDSDLRSELMTYPTSAVLSGMAFFVMGSHYWGRCYAIGAVFFGMAIAISFDLTWAPLVFGTLWLVILTSMSLHLGRLGREKGQNSEAGNLLAKAEPTQRSQGSPLK
jgi:eukaryotic-like serine/threonine-protein kinase